MVIVGRAGCLCCFFRFLYLSLGSGCGAGSAKPGTKQEFERAFTRFPENAAVSYLWPEGTYVEEAARFFFSDTEMLLLREPVPDATADVTAGNMDFAVIPQENTPGGATTSYIDARIAEMTRNRNADLLTGGSNESTDEDGFSTALSYTYYVTYRTLAGQTVEAQLASGKSLDIRIGKKVWDQDLHEGSTVRIKYLPDKPNYVIRI